MSICLSWSGPGLLLGQARCEVSGDECISSRLTGLGLSSGTSQPRYQQYQLRIAAATRSHFELVTATTELALGWCWSGQGRYTGGCRQVEVRSSDPDQRQGGRPGQQSCRPSCLVGDTAPTGAWPRSSSRHTHPLSSSGPGCQGQHLFTAIFSIHF